MTLHGQHRSPSGTGGEQPHTSSEPLSVQPLYERISAATCTEHGLGSSLKRELHVRAIVAHLYELRTKNS